MLYKSTLLFLTFHTFLWDGFSFVLTIIHLCINIWVDPTVFHFDTKYLQCTPFYTRSDLNRIFLYSRNEGREFLGHVVCILFLFNRYSQIVEEILNYFY